MRGRELLTGCARRPVGTRDAVGAGAAGGFSPSPLTERFAAAAAKSGVAMYACASTTAASADGTAGA